MINLKLIKDLLSILNRIPISQSKAGFSSCKMSPSKAVRYLGQDEAINLDRELFDEYAFSVDQLMELAGLGVASVIAKEYSMQEYGRPVIFCGPGNNGGDGLVCARHLSLFGYSPTVVCLKSGRGQLYQNLLTQCRKFDIEVLEQMPVRPLNEVGNLLVDCIFGFSFKPPNRNADFARLLQCVHTHSKKMPLVSVDIPSGWHVEKGPDQDQQDIDENLKLPVLEPDCLVSLTAPKLSARYFKGRLHYLSGRFCPKTLQEKYKLNLPEYSGMDNFVKLTASSTTTC